MIPDNRTGNFVYVSAEKKLIWRDSSKIIELKLTVDVSVIPYYLFSVEKFSMDNATKFSSNKLIDNRSMLSKPISNYYSYEPEKTSISFRERKYYSYDSNHATVEFKNGEFNKAIKYYKNSLEHKPGSPFSELMISKCESILSDKPAYDFHAPIPYLSITYSFPSKLKKGMEYIAYLVFSYSDSLEGKEASLRINLPEGCTAIEDTSETIGSDITTNNQQIKFYWDKLPFQNPFIISFEVYASQNVSNPNLTGNFSYHINGISSSQTFDNSFFQAYQSDVLK